MKVLVTGSTGFVGQHVIQSLLDAGHEVIASATTQTKAERFSWFRRVAFVEYTMPQFGDSADLYAYFNRPDLLIHLAWQGLPNYKASFHIDQNLFPHYLFLKNLIQNGLSDVAITGTCFEYGMQSGCLTEDVLPLPNNPYALAKDSLRRFLESLQREYPYYLKWIRLFYMYGEGQSANSIIPLLDQAIDRGDAAFNMSGGEQLRDYLPVHRVAEHLVQIATQQRILGIVNCCSGVPISVRRLVEQHIQQRQASISLNLGYYPYPDYEPIAFWGDNSKLKLICSFDQSC